MLYDLPREGGGERKRTEQEAGKEAGQGRGEGVEESKGEGECSWVDENREESRWPGKARASSSEPHHPNPY